MTDNGQTSAGFDDLPATIVSLGQPQRIWAVGAMFGQAEALCRLHAGLIDRLVSGDRLVYLGNYMGYGPAVAATIDELLAFRRRLVDERGWPAHHVVHLRGAQEEMWVKLLQIQWAMKPEETFGWLMRHGAEATLRAYGGEPQQASARFRSGVVVTTRWTAEMRQSFTAHAGHDAFVHRLVSAALTGDRRLLFVSAGLDPSKPLTRQLDAFWWSGPGFETMTGYDEFELIVRGYDAEHRGISIAPPVASIDAGCGFGGELAAVCFSAAGEAIDELSVAV